MRISFLIFLTIMGLCGFITGDNPANEYPHIPNTTVNLGEKLEYKVTFGVFTVGKALMTVSPNTYRINGRDCFRIDVLGKTSGAVEWVAKVNDLWGAYVDTAALVPHIAYRNLEEANYRRKEIAKFDHQSDMIEMKVLNNKTGEYKEPEYYKAPDNIRDIMGGYLYLRSLNFQNMKKGDTISVEGFFEDNFYDLRIIYGGKENLKTKAGTFKALKVIPIMPDNKLFKGENSITVWFSDDENKMPLKAEALMFIGSAGCELINFKNLKSKSALIKE